MTNEERERINKAAKENQVKIKYSPTGNSVQVNRDSRYNNPYEAVKKINSISGK